MDSMSLSFTHVNPQHLQGDYQPLEQPNSIVVNHPTQSFGEELPIDSYHFAQCKYPNPMLIFGHPLLVNTQFAFRAGWLNAGDDSIFLSPSVPANELAITGNEVSDNTSTSVKQSIPSVPDVGIFPLPYSSSENDDIFRQFQMNEVPDLFNDGSHAPLQIKQPEASEVHTIGSVAASTGKEKKRSQKDLSPKKQTKRARTVNAVKPKKEHRCETCGVAFPGRLDNLKRHKITVHGNKTELEKINKLCQYPA
ncbi:hypothetical protein DFH28DRAFT_880738 [Melampsora americana]|nr:hypothetical protein DFH28DRAFT_880738 [Melampsora americana]